MISWDWPGAEKEMGMVGLGGSVDAFYTALLC